MTAKTFGASLGALIKARRKAKGLTQTQLAEDAYGSGGKTRRISELESGLVSNPHPKTIDPLISVLGISEDEIEQCAKETGAAPDADLDRAYREARNLIEAIARQFENDSPDATLADLDAFLREKAREWAQLQERIRAIDEPDLRVDNLRASAEAALNQGLFDEVDSLLMDAEEIQQSSKTLKEVTQQAKLRVLRASTSLLKGDENKAVQLYLSAAEFFMPFDKYDGIRLLEEIARELYETGRRSLTTTFLVGARLLEAVEQMEPISSDRLAKSAIQYRLGLLYRSAAERTSGSGALNLLEKAISYARKSLSNLEEGDDPTQTTSATVSLGNCLFDMVKRKRDDSLLSEATAMLKSARDRLLSQHAEPALLACIHNSVGSAILQSLNYLPQTDAEPVLREGVASFRAAISAAEEYGDVEAWGAANNNLGNALAGIARLPSTKPEDRGFLRVRAIAAVIAAVETYPEAAFPFRFAEGHASLARIYWDIAASVKGRDAEPYLMRGMNSWFIYQQIYTKEQFPEQWADAQLNIGAAYGAHASIEGVETASTDLLEAKKHFKEALEVFRERANQEQIDYCQRALKLVDKRSKEIGKSRG